MIDPLFNATQVTGIFAIDFPDPSKPPTATNRPSPTKVTSLLTLFTELAFVDAKTKAISPIHYRSNRSSLAECSYMLRYGTVLAQPSLPVPPKDAGEFGTICAFLNDFVGSEGNWAGRLRHAWSVVGGTGIGTPSFTGHLTRCLQNSLFT